jgi:hypothetical protein
MKLFSFSGKRKSRSLFVESKAEVPLKIMVAIGKRHIVGIAELGDQSVTIEKHIIPLVKPPEPEEVAKELLKKLGIPQNEWEEILKSRSELTI